MEDGTAALADFGLSQLCEDENERLDSTEGTYFFMAPELYSVKKGGEGKPKGVEGKPLDIWALGVSFYAFLYLKVPFYGENMNEMIKSITDNEVPFGKERKLSEDLKRILLRMMEKDVEKRIKIEYLIFAIKNHGFFRLENWSWNLGLT